MKSAPAGSPAGALFCGLFLRQLKAVFLLHLGIFLMVHLGQEHVVGADIVAEVAVEGLIDNELLPCFRVGGRQDGFVRFPLKWT